MATKKTKAKVITIAVKKGGAGKTATAVNLSAMLAKWGHNVLLVDLDEQQNAGNAFKYESESQKFLEHLLEGGTSPNEVVSVVEDLPTLHVIKNCGVLETLVDRLSAKNPYFVQTFCKTLEPFSAAYDFLVLDTAPNFRLLVQGAIASSNEVVVPVMDMNGVEGLNEIKALIEQTAQVTGKEILLKPLYTRANPRAQAFKVLQKTVEEELALKPYGLSVPIDESHNKAQITLSPVVLSAKPTKSQEAYENLAKEISKDV